ncbi:MAG: ABC transporter permease subunit [Albidovulum sp.]|nr:ABC transporter permease subunit [Albidovulum sp.]
MARPAHPILNAMSPIFGSEGVDRIADRIADDDFAKGRSLWHDAAERFFRNRAATGALVLLLFIVAFSTVGSLLAVWSIEEIDWIVLADISGSGQPSLSNGHYFGVDNLGRDLFSRTLQATRTSLAVGIVGTIVAVFIGTAYGAVAGFAGDYLDNLMMRIVDVLIAVPSMFIIILLMVMFERTLIMLFIGIGVVSWLEMSRIIRGQTLTLKNREFVEAAHAAGVSWFGIVFRHIVPNLFGVVVVYATLLIPSIILVESFISFLGLGVQEPSSSLGSLISEGASTIIFGTLWQLAAPMGFFLALIVSLYFIGDGLRDALDPRDF